MTPPDAQDHGANRAQGHILSALPDDGSVMVRLDAQGRPVPVWENRIDLPDTGRDWLIRSARTVWAGVAPAEGAEADWSVNVLADPDMYARALVWHDDHLTPGARVFNHPRAVARTRRDLSAAVLAGVPGLEVPACHRFTPQGPRDFARVFAARDFRFPVLVRPCGHQGGTGQIRVDGPDGWDAAAETSWLGAPHFMTQFIESADAEGVYHKARVMFVAGRAFVRHVKASRHWLVHNQAAGRISDDTELPMIDLLEACPLFTAACEEVAARLHLDWCGMDVGIDPLRQRYVLFECNAAMAVFFAERPDLSAEARSRRARLQAPLARALDHHLHSPFAWVASRRPDAIAALPPVARSLAD